jgi:transcriptional regulator with XRE-family HTH domain
MDMADINQRKLANIAGVTKTAVSRTLNGLQHSPAVLDALRSIGVPEKYLFDPRKVEAAA